MKNFTLVLFLVTGLFSVSLQAQTNPAPEPWASSGVEPTGDAILAAFSIQGHPFPEEGTTDWVAAVDGDDAGVLLGFNRAEANFLNDFVGSIQVNQPTGPNNQFHLVFYDVSEQKFHVLNDADGDALTIDWVPDENGTFIEGYDIGPTGAFPGGGTPDLPGEDDFVTVALILPVELTAFSGNFNQKAIDLDWSTASEDGNDFFAVERSIDGERFTEIGRITGHNEPGSYTYRDQAPLNGNNYYRLRQTDFSGAESFSEVIVVAATGVAVEQVSVYPNPAKGTVSLNFQGEWEQGVDVVLFDQSGRQLKVWNRNSGELRNLDLPVLRPGIYQMTATDGQQTITTRLVIAR